MFRQKAFRRTVRRDGSKLKGKRRKKKERIVTLSDFLPTSSPGPPASTINTLLLCIRSMSHQIQPHSVHSYLAGIIKPFYPSVHPNWYSPLVVCTLKHSMLCFSGLVHQKSPLTQDDPTLIYVYLPRPLSHDNLLFLNMLCVGVLWLTAFRRACSQTPLSSLCQRSHGDIVMIYPFLLTYFAYLLSVASYCSFGIPSA